MMTQWQIIGPTVNGRTLVQHRETGIYAMAIASRKVAIEQNKAAKLAELINNGKVKLA